MRFGLGAHGGTRRCRRRLGCTCRGVFLRRWRRCRRQLRAIDDRARRQWPASIDWRRFRGGREMFRRLALLRAHKGRVIPLADSALSISKRPLLDAWKSITQNQQAELRGLYARVGEQAAETFRGRLENVSNQWMLATVASLDHQSREVVSGIAATAEEKLRDTCTRVFSDIGESLRERLTQIASNLGTAPPLPH